LFVGLFIVIKPENLYFVSRPGLEVKSLGVHPLGPREMSVSHVVASLREVNADGREQTWLCT
jgi:hypothetical protein